MASQTTFGEKEFETTETTPEAEDCKEYESLKGVTVTWGHTVFKTEGQFLLITVATAQDEPFSFQRAFRFALVFVTPVSLTDLNTIWHVLRNKTKNNQGRLPYH